MHETFAVSGIGVLIEIFLERVDQIGTEKKVVRHCQRQNRIIRKPAIRMKQFEVGRFDRVVLKT